MSLDSPRLRRELTRFSKFLVVGAVGAVVDFGVFNSLHGGLGIASPIAQAVSFSAAVVSNFLWNRYWTYPDSRSKPMHSQAVQFTLVNLIGLAIRTPLFVLSEPTMESLAESILPTLRGSLPETFLALLPEQASILGANLALALAVIVVLFWNFAVNRVWTYSDAP